MKRTLYAMLLQDGHVHVHVLNQLLLNRVIRCHCWWLQNEVANFGGVLRWKGCKDVVKVGPLLANSSGSELRPHLQCMQKDHWVSEPNRREFDVHHCHASSCWFLMFLQHSISSGSPVQVWHSLQVMDITPVGSIVGNLVIAEVTFSKQYT